ncbi:hypothetical protein AJ78_02595 [Emergomyces pasteurianus Ep9510]|uniref:Uncharacterized protein n=1 Tax=Emergomyces pasteurianus Ep9510 TaxID=1447872 RepID=A0A1J9QAQ0_9EURO|nr:hypothetical protein AJ78_02595 [Emergomyces pasteurianus Ep9510]
MTSVIEHGSRGFLGSTTDEGDTPQRFLLSKMRSRANGHTTSAWARDCTRMRRRNEVDNFLSNHRPRTANRRSLYTADIRHLSSRELKSNSPSLPHHREFFSKRKEEFESKSDSEESEDDDEDSDSDGDDASEDDSAGEKEGELEPSGSSGGIAPAGNSPTDTLAPGTSTPVTLVSGAISSTAANTTNPLPSKGGLASHPAHLAVLITGIVVAVVFIIFLATCVMIRSKRHQKPGGIYSRYQGLRRTIGLPSQDIPVYENDKIHQVEKDGMATTAKLYWEPESSFAKPSAKVEERNSQEKHTSIFRKALTGAKSSIPHIRARPKSLVLRGYNSTFGPPKVLPAYEEIQPLTKAHTVESSRSSIQLEWDQEKGSSQNILPPAFTSKFSWTNTPSTNTHTRSSTYTPQAPYHPPTVDENDAATVYTEDTEPVRFRSMTSWVLQQQVKSQQHTQSNPNKPKQPPSDIDSSISEDSRVPIGALPGIAI